MRSACHVTQKTLKPLYFVHFRIYCSRHFSNCQLKLMRLQFWLLADWSLLPVFFNLHILSLLPLSIFPQEEFVIVPCDLCFQCSIMMSSFVSQNYDAESGSHYAASSTSYPVSTLSTSAAHRRFSPARRLFCLLALFDFLTTLFIWILYAHVSNLLFFLLLYVSY